MKKKIIGILVCMLMLIPIFASVTTAQEEPEISTCLYIKDKIEIIFYIKNYGDVDLYDITYDLQFQERFPIKSGHVQILGTIECLQAGEEVRITSGPVFGFRLWSFAHSLIVYDGICYGHQNAFFHIIGPYIIRPKFIPNF